MTGRHETEKINIKVYQRKKNDFSYVVKKQGF